MLDKSVPSILSELSRWQAEHALKSLVWRLRDLRGRKCTHPDPLPPLATQQAIVSEIEAEQALVAANRELIARFEKKVRATLACVWGEDEPTPAEA